MKRKKRLSDYWWVCLWVPCLFILFWQYAGSAGAFNTKVLPTPGIIFDSFVKLIQDGVLQKHIAISLQRVIQGYIYGSIAGIFVGALMGVSPLIHRSLSFFTGILRPIPIIAWFPVTIMLFGIDETSKILIIAIGAFWPVLINVIDGIHNVDKKYIEVAEVFMKPKHTILGKIIFPGAAVSIFTGLKVGIGNAWVSVISAELLASSSGLGYLISSSRELAKPGSMMVGVFIIGIIGWAINTLLEFLMKFILPWNVNDKR